MLTMTCPPLSDQAFGPRVDTACRPFDFTLFFEDVVFICLSVAVFLPVAAVTALSTTKTTRSKGERANATLIAKLTLWMLLLVFQVAFISIRAENDQLHTKASVAADTLSLLATVAALPLSFLWHRHSPRPSTLLVVLLSIQTVLFIPRLRTLWLIPTARQEAGVFTAIYILTGSTLAMESVEQKPEASKTTDTPTSKEPYLGFWSRTSFVWLASLFKLGNEKIISQSDLPLLDPKLQSQNVHNQLQKAWRKEHRQNNRSLVYATFKFLLPSLVATIIPRLFQTVFTFAQPFMINVTLNYMEEKEVDPNYGKGLIGAWFLVYLLLAISHSVFEYHLNRLLTKARGSLIALVFDHSLRTRNADSGDITAIALMGTDVMRIVTGLHFLNEIWGCILDIGVACWLLAQQLSVACLAPIFLSLVFIAITSKVSASVGDAQKQWTEKVQERLKVTSAFLGNMKAVKMLGIGPAMKDIVTKLRNDEITTSAVFRKIITITMLLSLTPINLAPVFTFGIYIIIAKFWKNETLLSAQAFTSVALISLLTTPVIIFIQGMPQVLQSFSAFGRIQEYCAYSLENSTEETSLDASSEASEIQLREIGTTVPSQSSDSKWPVHVRSTALSWTKDSKSVLHDIDIKFAASRITAVVGAVSSGKSALINSIIDEMFSGEEPASAPERRLPIAFCAQEPWLENATIQKNITGPLNLETNWYNTVKWACNLDEDIVLLPSGDQTQIGTKGYSLSGGQKQRITLARAVYARAAVVVLDDVFSGMDAGTVSKVTSRLFGEQGLLRNGETTVILSSHNSKVVSFAHDIVVLENGRITDTGVAAVVLKKNKHLQKIGILSLDRLQSSYVDPNKDAQEPQTMNADSAHETEAAPVNDLRRKTGDLSVYKYYLKSSGYRTMFIYTVFIIIWTFGTELSTIWVKQWSEANERHPNQKSGMYFGVYALIGVVSVIGACLAAWSVLISVVSNSAANLHADLLDTTFKAPFWFFAETDSGEVLNRFSQDMELVDMDLPSQMMNYSSGVFACLARVIIVAIFSKYLGITIPFIIAALFFLQRFYLRTSRQLRLLSIEASAPLYTHFTECVEGAATIRAFGWQSHYSDRAFDLINDSRRPAYLLSNLQTCLTFVLEIFMTLFVVILAAIVIKLRDQFSAGSVGVSLVMVVGFGDALVRVVQAWTSLETSIGAIARVRRFVLDTPKEDAGHLGNVAANWAQTGTIEFNNVTASYDTIGEPVLQDVSFSIRNGEHVAICGRTGSGKSSLVATLLRMITIQRGNVVIDSHDISDLQADDLRAKINAMPQDSFLFPASFRQNLDPFRFATDDAIQSALTKVKLWDTIKEQGGLDETVDTEAWSAGQKQLLCFARAMVRKGKILVLDEAASNVDGESETFIQQLIDSEFKKTTVFSVTHRLSHAKNYDKVIVMDKGRVVEVGAPKDLLSKKSVFAELYQYAQ